jgi:hypothetical protein
MGYLPRFANCLLLWRGGEGIILQQKCCTKLRKGRIFSDWKLYMTSLTYKRKKEPEEWSQLEEYQFDQRGKIFPEIQGVRIREYVIDHKPLSVLQVVSITVKGPQIVFVFRTTIGNNWRIRRGRLYWASVNLKKMARLVIAMVQMKLLSISDNMTNRIRVYIVCEIWRTLRDGICGTQRVIQGCSLIPYLLKHLLN